MKKKRGRKSSQKITDKEIELILKLTQEDRELIRKKHNKHRNTLYRILNKKNGVSEVSKPMIKDLLLLSETLEKNKKEFYENTVQ